MPLTFDEWFLQEHPLHARPGRDTSFRAAMKRAWDAATAAPAAATPVIKYERRPELDRRIARGDDFAGDAWVRWTAVGHAPDGVAP